MGVGAVSACSLLAHLPELGKLPRAAIAALAGVAPMSADKWPQARPASSSRRASTRAQSPLHGRALRHAAQPALIKAFYQKLRGRGKPAKVALTAVMRKPLIHLNSLLKTPLQTTV